MVNVNFVMSLMCGGFKSSKCKTTSKLATARIKLLRNKREAVVKQMRRDIAQLLQSRQDTTARIRVEHVIREQNILAANEIIELFCELIVSRLTIIAKQRECPADLKEGISSLIFASPRCSDIPELLQLRDIFENKYGKEFVSAATDLRPNCGVNRTLIEKLSVRTPTGEVKLKLMKEIAKEYQIEWDPTESEKEFLKPPDELIEGPSQFLSATSLPLKPVSSQDVMPTHPPNRVSNDREEHMPDYEDTATAAKAAAESAEKAVAAAQAAAYLANRTSLHVPRTGFNNNADGHGNPFLITKHGPGNFSDPYSNNADGCGNLLSSKKHLPGNPTGSSQSNDPRANDHEKMHFPDHGGTSYESHNSERSNDMDDDEVNSTIINTRNMHRRHSNNVPVTHLDVRFDESDVSDSECDEDIEMETPPDEIRPPPNRPPPPVPRSRAHQHDDKIQKDDTSLYRRHSLPRVHPKLPDYDELSARFEALKFPKP